MSTEGAEIFGQLKLLCFDTGLTEAN